MSRFTILAGGGLVPTGRLKAQVAGARVIAADSGIAHAAALGLVPELWVGDFDSSTPELMALHAGVDRETHPPAKAATDTELACEAAIARGATALVIAGGFGGQADHALSHLLMAVRFRRRGIDVVVSSGREEAWPLVEGALRIELPPQSRMSVLPFVDLKAISLVNVEWPLDRRDVTLGSTLTLSNVALGPVDVTLERGYGVVIVYPADA